MQGLNWRTGHCYSWCSQCCLFYGKGDDFGTTLCILFQKLLIIEFVILVLGGGSTEFLWVFFLVLKRLKKNLLWKCVLTIKYDKVCKLLGTRLQLKVKLVSPVLLNPVAGLVAGRMGWGAGGAGMGRKGKHTHLREARAWRSKQVNAWMEVTIFQKNKILEVPDKANGRNVRTSSELHLPGCSAKGSTPPRPAPPSRTRRAPPTQRNPAGNTGYKCCGWGIADFLREPRGRECCSRSSFTR